MARPAIVVVVARPAAAAIFGAAPHRRAAVGVDADAGAITARDVKRDRTVVGTAVERSALPESVLQIDGERTIRRSQHDLAGRSAERDRSVLRREVNRA